MLKAIITVGISASGKTTWAREYCKNNSNWVNINRDDIREMLFGKDYKFSKKREQEVTEKQRQDILTWESNGANVIISDTNLNKERTKQLVKFLEDLGYEVEIKEFPIELQDAIKRDLKRENSVGYEVIHRQWKQWLEYTGRKTYTQDEYKPIAILFDIDGTLANMSGVRGPFDWDKVIHDKPIDVIVDMARGYSNEGYEIVCMSGRDECCESDTRKWLANHMWCYDRLFMRAVGDTRKDSIVKEELFWENVAPYYNVCAVVDDRPQVCRMWRDLGLKVIQVADPYKEF